MIFSLYKDLAKFGSKSDMKQKSLIILVYFWLHTENQNLEIWIFFLVYFSQFLRIEIFKKDFIFSSRWTGEHSQEEIAKSGY
jgi:hypothetical protein